MAYATLAQVKQYLGVTVTDDDALLTRLTDAASAAIDTYCGRTFSASTDTVRHRAYMWLGREIILRNDLQSLTSIVSDKGDTLTPAHVIVNPPARVIIIRDDAPAWFALDYFDVTGTWGYSSAPPDNIVQATVRMAAWMYRAKDAQTYDLSGMAGAGQMQVQSRIPADIAEMLRPYVVNMVMVI